MPATMTTGEAVAGSLVRHGVRTMFGIPGAHMYDFTDAVARTDELDFYVARHEQGAGYMAFGYAKSTGRTGVFTVVPGPGVLNASAALCTAYGANAPVLCVTGNVMSDFIGRGRGQLHELPDQLATIRGFTRWAERIDHPSKAPGLVAEAFRQMHTGRIRPVSLEAAWDVWGASAPVSLEVDRGVPAAPEPDPDQVRAAARLVAQARNPLIIVGAGACDAAAEVRELAGMLQAPVTAHRSGKGVVGNDHPLGLLPWAAWRYWPGCDLVLGIGSRLELAHMRWGWRPEGLRTVRIDIDPGEMVRLRPDAGIVADARRGVVELMDALGRLIDRRPSRAAECRAHTAAATRELDTLQPQASWLAAIREALPRDGFLVEEISQAGFAARLLFPVYRPRRYVTCGYQDNLGFGFQTALGVKVANPASPVVSINGDGGFMYGVQELATAVKYRLNVVAVVFNNAGFGNVRRDQDTRYAGRLLGSELENPDFVALAGSFGAEARRVTTAAALRSAVEDGLAGSLPMVIEVPVEPGSEASPWPFLHPRQPG